MGCRVTLGEICTINASQYSTKEAWTRIQYLDTGNVTRGAISELQQLDPLIDKVPSRARRKVKPNSIVYSMVRPNQEHYALLKKPPTNMLVSTGFSVIDANENRVLPSYLYYALTTNQATRGFQTLAEQSVSTYPTLSSADLLAFEIPLPSLNCQQRIAAVLECLDEKIATNTKLNGYLEELFAALFSELISSRDYSYVPLTDVIFFQEGPGIRNWQYVYDGDGVNFINIRCIQNHDLDLSKANQISVEEAYGKYDHFLVKPGDILMSSSGTLGRYAIARQEHLPLCMNTSVIRFRPLADSAAYAFVYGYLISREFYNHLTGMANGSAQVNFGRRI